MATRKLKTLFTTEELAEKAIADIQMMTPDEKAHVRAKLRKAFGPTDSQRMLGGLAGAAKVIQAEEKMKNQQFERFDKMTTESEKYRN
jgi:hypothetical protein